MKLLRFNHRYLCYNGFMNTNTVDWDKRKNITLPADKADVIIEEAKRQHVPVYRLVYDAVVAHMALTGSDDAKGEGLAA